MHSETFLDGILEESFKGKEVRHILIVRGESDREDGALGDAPEDADAVQNIAVSSDISEDIYNTDGTQNISVYNNKSDGTQNIENIQRTALDDIQVTNIAFKKVF
mgnify:FL=1